MREVFGWDHLGEVPAQGPIGAGEVADVRKLIDLVHQDQQLVRDAVQRLREDRHGLAGRAGFVGIEEKQDQVGALSKMPHDGGEVVVAAAGIDGGTDHAGTVHERQRFQQRQRPRLQAEVRQKLRPEALHRLERHLRMGNDRLTVVFVLRFAVGDDRKSVVHGGQTGLLNFALQEMIDKRRLAG